MVEIVRYPDYWYEILAPVPSVACVWNCKLQVARIRWIFPDVDNIVPVPAFACVDMTSSRKVGPFCHACYVLSCGLIPCDVTFIYSLFAHSRVLEETSTT